MPGGEDLPSQAPVASGVLNPSAPGSSFAARLMGTPELSAALELLRPHFRDAPAPSVGLAALEHRDPAEDLFVRWAGKHLTWEKLGAVPLLRAERELTRGASLRGLLGCVQGRLDVGPGGVDGRPFVLVDDAGRSSGGWIVGGATWVDSGEAPVVCGVVVGAQGNRGLRLIGMLEGAVARDRGVPPRRRHDAADAGPPGPPEPNGRGGAVQGLPGTQKWM
jgi:hypothetical protein